MELFSGMQNAINYMEKNLLSPPDYAEIARQAACSEYNFMRVFSILSGCTVADYIRRRRLTLAGQELAAGKIKVIDAAMKYGYDSPESFQRAFVKFHGISPSQARKEGAALRSLSPMVVKILIEGGTEMQYRIEKKPGMTFISFQRGEDDVQAMRTHGSEHWYDVRTEYNENGFVEYSAIKQVESDDERFHGIPEKNAAMDWAKEIADTMESRMGERETFQFEIPSEIVQLGVTKFNIHSIAPQTYAIFSTVSIGDTKLAAEALRRDVISQWLPGSGYTLANTEEIVEYRREEKDVLVELWIPIKA